MRSWSWTGGKARCGQWWIRRLHAVRGDEQRGRWAAEAWNVAEDQFRRDDLPSIVACRRTGTSMVEKLSGVRSGRGCPLSSASGHVPSTTTIHLRPQPGSLLSGGLATQTGTLRCTRPRITSLTRWQIDGGSHPRNPQLWAAEAS